MYHIFIHSSVSGHLGCFHVLAIANSASVKLGCMHPFRSCFPLFLCINCWRRLSYLFLLFTGTHWKHSDAYIFPFLVCFSPFFLSQLFVRPPQTAILLFHTVHGVLRARILKWFAIPFSSGPHSVRLLHHDPPILGCSAGMACIEFHSMKPRVP